MAWPLLQLAPLPGPLAAFSPISFYPYATIRTFLVVAGSVGLFLLARELCRRTPATLGCLAFAVLVLGLTQVLPALRQYLMVQTGAASGWDREIRGTLGNRNLLAAWLEGCYGVALGLLWAGLGRLPGTRYRFPAFGTVLFAMVAALAFAVTVVCSRSRMGILGVTLETLFFAYLVWRREPRGVRRPAAVACSVILCGVVLGLPGLAQRYSAASLAQEKEGRLAMWADSIRAARRQALWGAGAGAFPFAFRRSHPYYTAHTIDHPHNEYLETMVEWGIPATLLLVAGVTLGLWRGLRRLQQSACGREIGVGCVAGVSAILLHAAVDFPLRIPAILALASTLMGMAAAAWSTPREVSFAASSAAPVRHTNWVVIAASLGLAAVSLWSYPPGDGSPRRLERWNAEVQYRLAREHMDLGNSVEAEAAYRLALRANPHAAAVWSEKALLAEARGDRSAALRYSELAQEIEPFTRRGQWAAANLRLRFGDLTGAAGLFESLLRHSPELRRSVWQLCWDAGLEHDLIFDQLTGHTSEELDDYLRYLLDRGRWEAVVEASVQAIESGHRAPSPDTLRVVFDRLFAAGEDWQVIRLWKAVGGGRDSGDDSFFNGRLATPPLGYGLDWVVRPTEGVDAERRSDAEGFRLDIGFRARNIDYAGVTHDFIVTPGREYRLQFEAAPQAITSSSGVQVQVISPRRQLAVSPSFRRSAGWRTVKLRFRPLPGERICRLRVVRRPGSTFDNQITGRFSLRRVALARSD